VSLIRMIKLTPVQETLGVVGIQNQDLNFEVIKFGIVWTINLSLQFFIIYWH
jgi:hypothetical protein